MHSDKHNCRKINTVLGSQHSHASNQNPPIPLCSDVHELFILINPLNAELNPICHLLALLGAHHILHISRIRVKLHENR
jgi:hypothetical protein